MKKKINKFFYMLWNACALKTVVDMFNDDCHSIISKEGREILDDMQDVYLWDNESKTIYKDGER